jgi:methylthioribose-1-phosphate isomerase
MNGVWDFLFYHLPWWLQISLLAIPVVIAFAFAIQIFGWEKVRGFIAPALAVLAALGLLSRARQQGYGDRQAQEKQAEDKAKQTVDDTRKDTQALPDAKLDKEVDRWSR